MEPAVDRTAAERWRRATVTIATAGLALALVAGLAFLVAGPGHRFGWWSFGTGFALLRYAAYGGIAAAAVSAVALILAPLRGQRRGMFRALAGLTIGLITVGVPAYYLYTARSVPPIHDVTTDTEDPPAFDAILTAARRGAESRGLRRARRRGAAARRPIPTSPLRITRSHPRRPSRRLWRRRVTRTGISSLPRRPRGGSRRPIARSGSVSSTTS